MNDELSQLLRHADQQTPPPLLDATALPSHIRHSAKKQFQRKIATSTFLMIPLLFFVLLVATHHPRPTEKPLAKIEIASTDDLALQIAYHQRIASLLESHHQPAPPPRVTDAFLEQLQLERSKAGLVLLNSADDKPTQNNTTQTIARLHQTIALFPDTPAAGLAQQQITQLENSRSQS